MGVDNPDAVEVNKTRWRTRGKAPRVHTTSIPELVTNGTRFAQRDVLTILTGKLQLESPTKP